ncbi:cytochrome P450 [Polychytrium aggregatum]|uniref:cytochrome P450 n=1 Tax=Polychytrium aggregatum TaxID=110093 RepID=UPI0022FECF78|nr:cytochrome P450 [Polychytrium aggregatum]KAI9201870.1 cytochrome P450 [Polychytrium aggregatum]
MSFLEHIHTKGLLASALDRLPAPVADVVHGASARFHLIVAKLAAVSGLSDQTVQLIFAALAVVVFISLLTSKSEAEPLPKGAKLPPHVPTAIPFFGAAVQFGVQPIKFLQECQAKYGDCFTFTMMGRNMTYCLGPDGNNFGFNIKLAEASAEDAYRKLTAPVFGREVVYDVPNPVFMEQKKFIKDSLTTAAFREYISIIAQETNDFLDSWAPKSDSFEIFPAMAELTIRTASHCLMGSDVRSKLHSEVAIHYKHLDEGFAPINVFFEWLPLPAYIRRDHANREMTKLFLDIMKDRRTNNKSDNYDVLQNLMNSSYKDGKPLTDMEAARLMIALLMAGQHTSSTTTTWILLHLAQNPKIAQEIMREQSMVLTGRPDTPADQLPPLDYDSLRQLTYLDNTMKETLRMHSPLHTLMRKVVKNCEFQGYTIPKGHFLCMSPTVSQYDSTRFPDPETFDPTRHVNSTEGAGEWTINGVDISQKSAKSHFLPFGAGRHRCIGEAFAFVQVKTIISMMLRRIQLELPKDKNGKPIFPEADFTSLVVLPKKPCNLSYELKK